MNLIECFEIYFLSKEYPYTTNSYIRNPLISSNDDLKLNYKLLDYIVPMKDLS
jgi:hypothetical protein